MMKIRNTVAHNMLNSNERHCDVLGRMLAAL